MSHRSEEARISPPVTTMPGIYGGKQIDDMFMPNEPDTPSGSGSLRCVVREQISGSRRRVVLLEPQ